MKKHPLRENYERFFESRKNIKEGQVDIRKVDRKGLATNASDILDILIKAGARGTYDADSAQGTISLGGGAKVNFSTGAEMIHLDITDISSHAPEEVVNALVKFLKVVSNYQ